jgi:Zn-dependent M32 family carboxypeptidase
VNGNKIYKKTKKNASQSSSERAKDYNCETLIHPHFSNSLTEKESKSLIAFDNLRNFRPNETIFEAKMLKRGKEKSAQLLMMESQRIRNDSSILNTKINNIKKVESKKKIISKKKKKLPTSSSSVESDSSSSGEYDKVGSQVVASSSSSEHVIVKKVKKISKGKKFNPGLGKVVQVEKKLPNVQEGEKDNYSSVLDMSSGSG